MDKRWEVRENQRKRLLLREITSYIHYTQDLVLLLQCANQELQVNPIVFLSSATVFICNVVKIYLDLVFLAVINYRIMILDHLNNGC